MLNASEVGKRINRHTYTVLRWARLGLIPSAREWSKTFPSREIITFQMPAVLEAMQSNNLKFGNKKCKAPNKNR